MDTQTQVRRRITAPPVGRGPTVTEEKLARIGRPPMTYGQKAMADDRLWGVPRTEVNEAHRYWSNKEAREAEHMAHGVCPNCRVEARITPEEWCPGCGWFPESMVERLGLGGGG